MSLGVWKFTHGHLRLELFTLGRASLHLDVEVPLLVLLLNLNTVSQSVSQNLEKEKSKLKINIVIVDRSDGWTHLKVERNVLVLQQAGSPERVTLLVIQRARVLDLLLGRHS